MDRERDEVKPLDVFEDYAHSLVSQFSGLNVVRFDSGGGSEQRPDFELFDESGLVGYLEVSSNVNREEVTFNSALQKARERHGPVSGLARDWMVYVNARASVKELLAKAGGLLKDWENLRGGGCLPDVDTEITMNVLYNDVPLGDLLAKLRRLQITSLIPLSTPATSTAGRFVLQVQALDTMRADPVAEVQKVLDRPDNLAKLAYSAELPSEMFVWLYGTEGSYDLASRTHDDHYAFQPFGPLRLPRQVRRVWVAAMPAYNIHWATAMWTFTVGGGWVPRIPR